MQNINNKDNVQQISEMKRIIQKLLIDIDNQYYITNIIVEIVTITFEYVKVQNYDEIRIMSSYEKCIETLNKMCDNNMKFEDGNKLLKKYKDVLLEKENIDEKDNVQ